SMTAWFITRVRTWWNKLAYYLFVASMIVPFQMVMYTMVFTADRLSLNNPVGVLVLYLGFGAGLSVFMFSGFVRSIPLEIEEAATIDGCRPLSLFFRIVFPMLRPIAVTVAVLNAMWIWNDYLLPYLVLGTDRYKTLPVTIQITMQGAYGSVDWGGFMAMLVLAIIPILLFYAFCQKYIIKGVIAGAIKG
ncbi:MAG: carbohydrate ABC transporter permease, partial [Clostridia bacterium]|nr:carbohydrate ABC transporter permease [Clostridia bacterium]